MTWNEIGGQDYDAELQADIDQYLVTLPDDDDDAAYCGTCRAAARHQLLMFLAWLRDAKPSTQNFNED